MGVNEHERLFNITANLSIFIYWCRLYNKGYPQSFQRSNFANNCLLELICANINTNTEFIWLCLVLKLMVLLLNWIEITILKKSHFPHSKVSSWGLDRCILLSNPHLKLNINYIKVRSWWGEITKMSQLFTKYVIETVVWGRS